MPRASHNYIADDVCGILSLQIRLRGVKGRAAREVGGWVGWNNLVAGHREEV